MGFALFCCFVCHMHRGPLLGFGRQEDLQAAIFRFDVVENKHLGSLYGFKVHDIPKTSVFFVFAGSLLVYQKSWIVCCSYGVSSMFDLTKGFFFQIRSGFL